LSGLALAAMFAPAAAVARPIGPIDPGDPELPPFAAPAGGFDWSVPERFTAKADGRYDWKYDEVTATYQPGHVNPASFPVDLYGCQTQYDADNPTNTQNTYDFVTADGKRSVGRNCRPRLSFTKEGTYQTRLTVRTPGGQLVGTWTKDVVVKDVLVVALGDSIAAGEGTPEYDRRSGQTYADWVDDRCHRSSFSGPAQAARQLEREDSRTSVTFVSFACSGATINKPMAAEVDAEDPWKAFTADNNAGSGVLGPYIGVQPPTSDRADKLPSQVDQLKRALGVTTGVPVAQRRQIDALLLSAGANDAGFGLIGVACIRADYCNDEMYTRPDNPMRSKMTDLVAGELTAMHGRYDALAEALRPANLGVDVRGTFITEYADPGTEVRADSGQVEECEEILEDVAWLGGMEMEGRQCIRGQEVADWKSRSTELGFARKTFLPTLNGHISAASSRHGWTMVKGISDRFLGHGYCVGANDQDHPQRYIQTAALSAEQQGPVTTIAHRDKTRGMLHPNVRGYAVYRDQILASTRSHVQGLSPDRGLRYTF
jgi:hypothetical protein